VLAQLVQVMGQCHQQWSALGPLVRVHALFVPASLGLQLSSVSLAVEQNVLMPGWVAWGSPG
jgi:hypothetical protein